mgnify:CR=1 FL=1
MVEIKGSNLDYDINGYVSNINVYKSTKSSITTIVNGRIVTNQYVNRIIKEAYHTFLAENKFPIAIINIETDPTIIDVNIHPTKQDIKFSKMDTLEELLFSLIRDKLNNTNNTYKAYIEEEAHPQFVPLKEEFLVTVMGPFFQIIGAFFYYQVTKNELFLFYHHVLLFLNLLPIIPLDGSKIINVLYCKIFP